MKKLIEARLNNVHAKLTQLFNSLEACSDPHHRRQIEAHIDELLPLHSKLSELLNN